MQQTTIPLSGWEGSKAVGDCSSSAASIFGRARVGVECFAGYVQVRGLFLQLVPPGSRGITGRRVRDSYTGQLLMEVGVLVNPGSNWSIIPARIDGS